MLQLVNKKQIQAIRLTEVDDWHDPAQLLADVKRCEAAITEKPPKGRDPQLILRELASMAEGCEQGVEAGGEVQVVDDMEGEEEEY